MNAPSTSPPLTTAPPRPALAALAAHPASRWLEARTGRRGVRSFRVRVVVQLGFALACALLGWQFARFIHAAQAGAETLPVRPPGVEGFLPISGLMGALDWLYSGSLNAIHPAATVLFLLFVGIAILFRKAFCSWICPGGLWSDVLAKLGRRLFGRNVRLPAWLDVGLRGLKYLLLGFFVWVIFRMDGFELRAFLESPYNRVVDVKMYLFFARAGTATIVTLGVLSLVSVFVQNAWCRYLCPYGALLGLFSWLSPVRVRRNTASCTDCGACDRACGARLPVSKSLAVASVECTACLDCVASCPVRDTLTVGTPKRRLSPVAFAAALLLFFLAGYGAARVTGHWQNDMGAAQYRKSMSELDRYGHPGM